MERDTREIDEITFGIYSAQEILGMAVCKLDNPKKSGSNTVYDYRMGTTDSTRICETCKEGAYACQGHFGYIDLNEPIIHPLYYKRVVAFLNCFCFKCYRLLLIKDQIYLAGLNRYRGESRFTAFTNVLRKFTCAVTTDAGQTILDASSLPQTAPYLRCTKVRIRRGPVSCLPPRRFARSSIIF